MGCLSCLGNRERHAGASNLRTVAGSSGCQAALTNNGNRFRQYLLIDLANLPQCLTPRVGGFAPAPSRRISPAAAHHQVTAPTRPGSSC